MRPVEIARALRDGISEENDLALQVAATRPEAPARIGHCICGAEIEAGSLSAYCGPCGRNRGAR